MKARFGVGVNGAITFTLFTPELLKQPQQSLHAKLRKDLSECPPGIYEVDILKVLDFQYPEGAWVRKQGAKIVPVKTQ